MKDFSKLCTPAKIYFAIAVIATLFDLLNGVSFMFAFWKMLFAFIWTFVLGGLCDKGYKSISWVLVLLPYILMFLASLNIYHVTDEQRQFMRSIQLQGAFGQEAFSGNAAQNTFQEGLQNLSQSQVNDIVKNIIGTSGEAEWFKKKVKKLNKSSLERVKTGVEADIASLTNQINNTSNNNLKNALKGRRVRQKSKLDIVQQEINTRS